jgi:DNA polymerase-3 subunit gamma/tau
MFENLLAQDRVKTGLVRDLEHGTVPPTLLFAGPAAAGKMTAALETARIMSCSRTGAWNCSCSDCLRHRSLVHGDLLIIGKRSLPEEITVAGELFLRAPAKGSSYFFIRSVRKLMARFNPILWVGEESRLSKASALLLSIEETLDILRPEAGVQPPEEILKKAVDSIVSDTAALEQFVPEQPPVFMIRNLGIWAQLSPSSKRKTIIIENAERMQESSRNAMLKILEEPPETVRFILLTSRRASIMATILSRSRVYAFAPRDEAAAREIAHRVFKIDEPIRDLHSFFESRTGFPPSSARREAERFVGLLLNERRDGSLNVPDGQTSGTLILSASDTGIAMREFLDQLSATTGGFGGKDKRMSGSFPRFLKAILSVLDDILRESRDDPATIALVDRWTRLLRTTAVQYQSLNRNPELLIEIMASSFGESE